MLGGHAAVFIAGSIAKYASFGVLPDSLECLCSLYHVR
ncbi:hypothetical protein PAMC26577_11450 [Caballeronia sordidicola]|uniref:Uncharacterized protein n=1 Tax=Caballeronia sordidicola TaxID=196367 RepID=A0A242MXS1_CABSO|nr:hypothetical protein PAMC26577_11450 [Caballeronia sordidicola]